ncbi:MAG: alpha/beta fold hydrolase, partial [Chloroflexi bacterium]|nr:alpha/beta fold hydrolase [Chloroflexota bacterium]
MDSAQDQYIAVKSQGETINTRFRQAGSTGSNIVMVHGLGGYLENWEQNIPLLAREHRVYALDLVGFGYTDKPTATNYAIPYLAQFLKDFMATIDLPSAAIIGHSLGGAIALQMTLLQPEVVEKLILVSSGGLGREVSSAFKVLSLPLIGRLLIKPNRKAIARGLKASFYDDTLVTDERVERGYKMASIPGVTDTILTAIRTSVNFFGAKSGTLDPIYNNLDQVSVPTLVVWGKQDLA